jgi:tRNA-Thr(GGU) m(6)t(6)A37 methyltransferase TsaA
MAPAERGVLQMLPTFASGVAVAGLEQVSHVWLLFPVQQALESKPRRHVRPPRLGGNRMVGVFATRATHRPNGIGQSVVRLDKVEPGRLFISGIDLLDGTPVLDIKPYVPYADALPDARNEMAADAPGLIEVQWSNASLLQASHEASRLGEPLVELIEQCLAQDPRPAYQKPEPERRYGAQFWDVDVRWHYPTPGVIRVLEVAPAAPQPA